MSESETAAGAELRAATGTGTAADAAAAALRITTNRSTAAAKASTQGGLSAVAMLLGYVLVTQGVDPQLIALAIPAGQGAVTWMIRVGQRFARRQGWTFLFEE